MWWAFGQADLQSDVPPVEASSEQEWNYIMSAWQLVSLWVRSAWHLVSLWVRLTFSQIYPPAESSCVQESYYIKSAWHLLSLWVRLTFSQTYPPVQASSGQEWYYIRSGWLMYPLEASGGQDKYWCPVDLIIFPSQNQQNVKFVAVSWATPDKNFFLKDVNFNREKVFEKVWKSEHIGFGVCQSQCTMWELYVTSTSWVIMVFLDFWQDGLGKGFWNMM